MIHSRPAIRYVSLLQLSDLTGLPVQWLRAELDAGRLPAIKANRRTFINLAEAEALLAARAKEGGRDER